MQVCCEYINKYMRGEKDFRLEASDLTSNL